MSFEGSGQPVGASFRRIPECGGTEVMHAQFSDFSFRKHAHDRLGVGIVTKGAMRVDTPRGAFVAEPGTVMTVNPDTVHWGEGEGATAWCQHILFFDEDAFAEMVSELGRAPAGDKFGRHIMEAPDLWKWFAGVHATLGSSSDTLEREDTMLTFIAALTERSGLIQMADRKDREPQAVATAREFIDSRFAEQISLDELAALTGVSGYALTRAFKKAVGMPPHAYQVHRRVRHAEHLLRAGHRPIDVASDCGFADQAHLTRAFRQATALTPAQFRAG